MEKNEDTENKYKLNCDLKCCLEKGHEKLLKCCIEDCNCMCRCKCECKKKNHEHICNKCKDLGKCKCECNCKHLCRYPSLLHNFICVCLDFEGLGTFERSIEQDIQMALIGSAMGNNIIFRTHNSYDRFTEETLEKLSMGSQRVGSSDISHLFGGSLIFSPRDVNEISINELRDEFDQKIKESEKKWREINNININVKNQIFGLFDDYVFAPTPSYLDQSFYNTLRDKFTVDLIGNTLKFERHPIYKTGIEFYRYLRSFLLCVYSNNFDSLTNKDKNDVADYIKNNKIKAYEVIGWYNDILDLEANNYFNSFNNLKIYFNKNYLRKLDIDFNSGEKFDVNNYLLIDNLENLNTIIEQDYNLDEYKIKLSVKKKNEHTFSLIIENLDDFGLILLIPEKYKLKIAYDDLCLDYLKLWKNICNIIGFKDKNKIIKNFELFINSLIERRYNNVNEWLRKITEKYEELENLTNIDQTLKLKWSMCPTTCSYCNYKCYLQMNHIKTHDCSYNHKCEEECFYCNNSYDCKEVCNKNCLKESGHEGIHTCKHNHKCKGQCQYFDKTTDCLKDCKIGYPHEGDHICENNEHHCNGECKYKDSRTCGKKCKRNYPHFEECNCLIEPHLCEKYCDLKGKSYIKENNENKDEFCTYTYGHEGNIHRCGKTHFCKETCWTNCGDRCKYKYEDEHDKHICEKQFHQCKKPCKFSNISKQCNNYCVKEYGHTDTDCICDIPNHMCNKKCNGINCNRDCNLKAGHPEGKCSCGICNCQGICKYHNNSRECQKICQFKLGHNGEHLCCAKNHYCKVQCIYKNKSRNCNEFCSYILENDIGRDAHSKHTCNVTHLCKEVCIFYSDSPNCITSNCIKNCCREINEQGQHLNNEQDHICDIKDNHLCNKPCYLQSESSSSSCDQICKQRINLNNFDRVNKTHQGQHFCNNNNHICKEKCKFYKYRDEKCPNNCCLKTRHQKDPSHKIDCICSGQHICRDNCEFYGNANARGCRQYCSKILRHPESEKHNCGERHLCNNKCAYCIELCTLDYGHNGKCHFPTIHPCDQRCEKYDGKCINQCSKGEKGHSGPHICNKPENQHYCQKKCILCDEKCGHSFGHENTNNLKCDKCLQKGRTYCILCINNNHLCGKRHKCPKKCGKTGYCIISGGTIKKELYDSNSGKINFDLIEEQKLEKIPCCIEIPEYELDHAGSHVCGETKHKCGNKCPQCGNFCKLEPGHSGLHFAQHGNIKNSKFCLTSSSDGRIKKSGIDIHIIHEDDEKEANLFLCDEYCKSQEQGHVHLLNQIPFTDENKVRKITIHNNIFYECKCSYFWKNILKFDGNFGDQIQEKFSLCNFYCDGEHNPHKYPEKVYCSLPLWHESEEHVFNCDHSNGAYTIFLIDKSGSMSDDLTKPDRTDIQHNNMMGAAIQELLSYCENRDNKKEKCAVIGYENTAELVFKNYHINELEKIKNKCNEKLKPDGGTQFLPAFKLAQTLLGEIKEKGYIPVIILLTDGLDFYHAKTLEFIENTVSYFI